ncbi:unnamed protein product, partial [Prorocentrum cordatum]
RPRAGSRDGSSRWECPRCKTVLPSHSHQCWTCSERRPPREPSGDQGAPGASPRSSSPPLDSSRLRRHPPWSPDCASGPRLDFGGYHNLSTTNGRMPERDPAVSRKEPAQDKSSCCRWPTRCEAFLVVAFFLAAGCGAKYLVSVDPAGLPEPVLSARQRLLRPVSRAEHALGGAWSALTEHAAGFPALGEPVAGEDASSAFGHGAAPGAAAAEAEHPVARSAPGFGGGAPPPPPPVAPPSYGGPALGAPPAGAGRSEEDASAPAASSAAPAARPHASAKGRSQQRARPTRGQQSAPHEKAS